LMLIQNFRSSCESVISSAARVAAAIPTNSIADRQHHPTEIISSPCPSSDGGTVRPSAVPVWRLRKNPPMSVRMLNSEAARSRGLACLQCA
jgi:hypothetical protein